MERNRRARSARGAALLLALILLGVLTAIAVAAVTLSTQERTNAADYSRVDFVNACANAAQAKLWAEVSYQSSAYFGSGVAVTSVELPDGTKLTSPAHYDADPAHMPIVKDVVLKVQSSAGEAGNANERDCTNGACGLMPFGATQLVVAHCRDVRGRELEIELGVKFAL